MTVVLNGKTLPEYSSDIEGYTNVRDQLPDCCETCVFINHDYDDVQECMHPDYLEPHVDRYSVCPKFLRSVQGAYFCKGDSTDEHKIVKHGVISIPQSIRPLYVSIDGYISGEEDWKELYNYNWPKIAKERAEQEQEFIELMAALRS